MTGMSPLQQRLADLFAVRQTRVIALAAAELIGDDPGRMTEAWQLYRNASSPLRERLCWAIWHAIEAWPTVVTPEWLEEIALALPTMQHDAEKRTFMHVMASFPIPEACSGPIYELAFAWLNNPQEAVANRVHAMEAAYHIARPYPDLLAELALAIRAHLPYGSPGFKNRGQKILVRIEKRDSL